MNEIGQKSEQQPMSAGHTLKMTLADNRRVISDIRSKLIAVCRKIDVYLGAMESVFTEESEFAESPAYEALCGTFGFLEGEISKYEDKLNKLK